MDEPEETVSVDKLIPLIYEELRRLASAVSWSSGHQTLNPTALVNEAYLKLALSKELSSTSTLHFKRIAAKAMRQVLCDASRRKLSIKRGEGVLPIALDDQLAQEPWSIEQVVAIDQLIDQLRDRSPRQADLVECRFFGGLTDHEIALELGVSQATVERDWKLARAWLNSRMYE